ncbi:MAG: hypothetical protein DBP01_09800 [gamma proteobacterium symbiont of Ctena orbiculata]|nr:MAG: hypothetical protein DBP01_09800 [gamma proteobacterium symbiont of Ctena orbiculata]
MSDEQRRVAHFQAQPEELGLFFHPAALSFAHLARLNLAHSALLGKKTAPAESIGLVLTGPNSAAADNSGRQSFNRPMITRAASVEIC